MKTAVSTHKIKIYPENDFEGYHAEVAKDIKAVISEAEAKEQEWFNQYEARTKAAKAYAQILEDVLNMMEACTDSYKSSAKAKLREQIPFWNKFNLTIDEAVAYFGIGEKNLRYLVNSSFFVTGSFSLKKSYSSIIKFLK